MVDEARREFGARLRSLRRRAGMTGAAVAERAGWPKSKVSKLETGQQLPTDEDLTLWCQATDARRIEPELRADLRNLESLVAAAKQRSGDLLYQHEQRYERERRAESVFEFELVTVPAMLQTEEYAARLMDSDAELLGGADVEGALEVRRRRAKLIDGRRDIRILLGEQALWSAIGSAEVMLAQLDHLRALVESDTVSIGVVPRTAAWMRRVTNFALIDDSVAIAETLTSDLVATTSADVDVFRRAWGVLESRAATGRAAAELIDLAAQEWMERPPGKWD
ncbi:DUF5753 domain-containing protein [Nocardia sp. NPDC004860]|uniref:DUF5753 domain-containing protein n=1 Tax=Nocardia sp. NPDC004860 TaxID=3154557 RepID=UPI0033BF066C